VNERHASAIYEGWVSHRRTTPVEHAFRVPLFMMYLDLAELPELFDGHALWSARRAAPAWFRRRDYLGDPAVSLEQSVRELVAERTATSPQGPIRLLTQLRYFGYCINPVSFYFCFDATERHLSAVVADVTNTPWRESHSYVLPAAPPTGPMPDPLTGEGIPKLLHVSPFMAMENTYSWHVGVPGPELALEIQAHGPERAQGPLFDAQLQLVRREISHASLARVLARYPLMTLRVAGGIYAHAARLKLKGAPYFAHPGAGRPASSAPHAARSRPVRRADHPAGRADAIEGAP
jgi:DUF1365 family protein